jgi:hypothetical protein
LKTEVRRASESDLPWLVSRLKTHFSDAYGTKRPFFQDEEFTTNFLRELIQEHVVLVATRAKELVGGVAGIFYAHPYDPSLRVLQESLLWVEPSSRNSRAGKLLLDAFTRIGKERAGWICFGMPPKTNIKDEAMTRRGYRLAERNFVMECV